MVRMSTYSATGDLVMEQAFDRLIWLLERLNILNDNQVRNCAALCSPLSSACRSTLRTHVSLASMLCAGIMLALSWTVQHALHVFHLASSVQEMLGTDMLCPLHTILHHRPAC